MPFSVRFRTGLFEFDRHRKGSRNGQVGIVAFGYTSVQVSPFVQFVHMSRLVPQLRERSMSFTSAAAKNLARRVVTVMTIAAAAVLLATLTKEFSVRAQSHLPEESAGIDGIAQALVSVFDQADILALGEAHGRKLDSDLRIAVVRHPEFAKKVRTIVVEFGSTSEQSTLGPLHSRRDYVCGPTGAGLEDGGPGR